MPVLVLFAAVAVAGAVHAAGVSLPHPPAAAAVAALPWALFLLGFGLCLSVLRHRRAARAAAPPGDPGAVLWRPWAAAAAPPMPLPPLPARPEKASGGADPEPPMTCSPPGRSLRCSGAE